MPTKRLYIDGNGILSITNYANSNAAHTSPTANIDDVYLHSSLPYLRLKQTFGPVNVTLPAIAKSTYTPPAGGGGGKSGGATGLCVVATELTHQGQWTRRDYNRLTSWSRKKLDKTFLGRCLHYGYPVVAQRLVLPYLKQSNTWLAKYLAWSFNNGTALLQNKSFSWLSLPSVALWATVMTIVGLFITKKQHLKIVEKLTRSKHG